jgi:hypothetical protein
MSKAASLGVSGAFWRMHAQYILSIRVRGVGQDFSLFHEYRVSILL